MAKRWIHKEVARQLEVPESVVRTIYAAVQEAKKQGMYGGQYADFVEREVGRKLYGNEYTVSASAKQHLGYDPPGGYSGGPELKGRAKEPARARHDDPQVLAAKEMAHAAERLISAVQKRWAHNALNDADYDSLKTAATELEVGTSMRSRCTTRAKHAREVR